MTQTANRLCCTSNLILDGTAASLPTRTSGHISRNGNMISLTSITGGSLSW
jgi:hypothetical protein